MRITEADIKPMRSPAKPCAWPGCKRLTHERYCPEHQKAETVRYDKYERSSAHKERYGAAWKKIRAAHLAAHPFCEECRAAGKLVAADTVHHIIPLAEGGTNAPENLISVCHACHSRHHALSGERWHNK